jgi:hypothetical protein
MQGKWWGSRRPLQGLFIKAGRPCSGKRQGSLSRGHTSGWPLPGSLNMPCSLLKQWFLCCCSPPWRCPASFHCLSRFCPSCKAHLKGQLLPCASLRAPSYWSSIPSTTAVMQQFCTLFFVALCSFLWVDVLGRGDEGFMCVLCYWLSH